jgi:hypothetical protein
MADTSRDKSLVEMKFICGCQSIQGVTRFAVLDDEDDDLDGLPLFQSPASTGLTNQMAHALVGLPQLQDRKRYAIGSSR